jgi:hypothetical protein
MLSNNNIESFDNFNADDLINLKTLELLIDCDPIIMKRIDRDFRDNNLDSINYKTMINFYNKLFSHNNININRIGIHNDYFNITNEIEYIIPDKETNYLKNLANLLTLKHLLNSVEKTKLQINNQIQKLKAEINQETSNRHAYNNLLRKNMNDIFPEEELFKPKNRPETANPYHRNNSKQTVPMEDSKIN